MHNSLYRTLDANVNRACEGLRVLEDVSRFTFDCVALCSELKQMRHLLRDVLPQAALQSRDTTADVGTAVEAAGEYARSNLASIIAANAKRAQEALRVIEEHLKLLPEHVATSPAVEQARYRSYVIEQQLQQLVPANRLLTEKLYVLIDEDSCTDSLKLAQQLAEIPVGIVQYRAKQCSEAQYYERAARMRDLFGAESLFIVNDYINVAAAINADGVHLGQDDSAAVLARAALGSAALIGLSTHTVEQIQLAHAEPIDYIGIGPMFATQTKAHEPVRGPDLLTAAADDIKFPSYAIGGIAEEQVQSLLPTLPHGVAIAGAICRAENPAAVYEKYQALLHA